MMKTVYIVQRGVDCEGASVQAVFANKDDAIAFLDEHFPKWKKVSDDERREMYEYKGSLVVGCESAFIEEWDVE